MKCQAGDCKRQGKKRIIQVCRVYLNPYVCNKHWKEIRSNQKKVIACL
jgi:hypothetical protein